MLQRTSMLTAGLKGGQGLLLGFGSRRETKAGTSSRDFGKGPLRVSTIRGGEDQRRRIAVTKKMLSRP